MIPESPWSTRLIASDLRLLGSVCFVKWNNQHVISLPVGARKVKQIRRGNQRSPCFLKIAPSLRRGEACGQITFQSAWIRLSPLQRFHYGGHTFQIHRIRMWSAEPIRTSVPLCQGPQQMSFGHQQRKRYTVVSRANVTFVLDWWVLVWTRHWNCA